MSNLNETSEQRIWNSLKAKGLTNHFGIAGLMGNLYAESALKSTNLQNSYEKKLNMTDTSYTDAVDNGTYTNFVKDKAGYGLAQWTYWSRKENLLKFAKETKRSIGDIDMQIDFLWKELSGSYPKVLNVLKTARSVRQASDAVLLEFERPASVLGNDQALKERTMNNRAEYGQKYYNQFAGSTNESAPSNPPNIFVPYPVRVTGNPLNIRSGPGTNHSVVNSIRDKGIYIVIGESDGTGATKWGKLQNGSGWISLDFTTKI